MCIALPPQGGPRTAQGFHGRQLPIWSRHRVQSQQAVSFSRLHFWPPVQAMRAQNFCNPLGHPYSSLIQAIHLVAPTMARPGTSQARPGGWFRSGTFRRVSLPPPAVVLAGRSRINTRASSTIRRSMEDRTFTSWRRRKTTLVDLAAPSVICSCKPHTAASLERRSVIQSPIPCPSLDRYTWALA